ncbi:MAG: YdcF family protein [Lachnospiraceae bacterium]|nr:YdcF family protein [Lachnospiraceae bacterium]
MARIRKKKSAPMQEHKNVIQIEDRVRGRVLKRPAAIFGILGVLSVLYCFCIWAFLGYGTYFFLIWGVIGLCFGLLSLLCAKPVLRKNIPLWLMRAFWICFGIGLAIFFLVEGLIFTRCGANAQDGADYLIVLGAQWKTTGPSKVLWYRLDQAVHYLKVNRETKVIVSGGQGPDEPISEAQGMRDYLVGQGIDGSRIIMEDKSTNTYENLKFSAQFLDKENDKVVVLTNNYHVYRAEKLAKGQGYLKAQGLAADSYAPMQAHNLLREFFGVVKDFFMGNFVSWERE